MGRRTATARRRSHALTKAVNSATALTLTATPVQRPFGLLEALNAATNHGMPPGDYRPMPRDPHDLGAFGPGQPIQPEPIDPLDPRTGRPEPRVWEYPQSWNLPGNNRREVPWQVLRAAAAGVGLIRRCIEVRKAHVADLQWSWSVRATVVEKAYNSSRDKGYDAIAAELREQHQAEIERLTARWEQPWPHQDWTFDQWVRSMLEELLVIDAGVIYPRMSLAGEILDLEQVDGSTIKPLLDYRGIRPAPPFPAYQQETWGFPRGEWAASTTLDAEGNEVIDNAYASSEMFYFRANPRVTSPYGLSPVEQALIDSRLYLKRMNWMLAEYEDGSTPLTWIETPENPGQDMKPADRRIWEESVNAEYSGNNAARHRMKVGAPGWKIHQLTSADERYKPDFDLHLIKLVAGYFGVTATELGFSETTGLGSAGWQEGQAEVGGRVGLRPDVKALTGLINGVSRQFLNAPPEIEFSFIDPASENDKDSDSVADAQLKRAVITINDDRRRLKLPLFSFPEADMPMLVGVGTSGYVFVDGAKQAADDAAAAAVKQQEAAAEGQTGKLELEQAKLDDGKEARHEEQDLQRETRDAEHDFQREQAATTTKAADPGEVAAELDAFRTWRRRHPDPKRPFVFKTATPDDLEDAPGPDVASFGDEWAWVEDIEKYESWWPRDSRGRWVKRSHMTSGGPLLDALRDMNKPGRHVTDSDIRGFGDEQLFDFFSAMSRRRELDEPLMNRLIEDMDRRDRARPFTFDGEELTNEQKRVDDLVAGGRDWMSAYAEVHGDDEAKLSAGEATSAVDRHAGETLQQAVRRSYDEWLHMTYLEAEKATRGNMLNRAGKRAQVDPLTLFTGPVSRARRYASEDLMRWWRQNKRMNLTEFRAQVLRRDRDRAAAAVTAGLSTGRDYL